MKNTLLVPELRDLVLRGDSKTLQEFCSSSHPSVIAEFLAALPPDEIWKGLTLLGPRLRAEIFGHLDVDLQTELTGTLTRRDLTDIITHMSADERVDLLKRLPEDKQEVILPGLAHAEREDVRRLFSYPEGTAGSVMTSDYVALSPEDTVSEALARLRREAPDKETIYYSYALDPQRKLIGFISLKDLILARPETKIDRIMHRDVIFTRVNDDQEEAADIIAKYDLIALPVVDSNDVLVGIITHDDAIDIIRQEHTEDMEKFMAIAGKHETGTYLRTPSWAHFKNRCGWLVILAALGMVSGYIVQRFEGLLMQFAILATFMPMLADTGGNTGSQSATLVVRALAIKEISHRDLLKVILKELKVSVPLALLLACLAFGRVIFSAGHLGTPGGFSLSTVGIAIGLALGIQVVTATLIGAILPLAAAKLNLDPAVVASPALTTIVDITGLLIYFTTVNTLLGF